MSAERPLLVATPLVPPILRGEKRVTRRLIRAMGNRRHIDRLLGDWSLSGKPEPYIGVERPWRPTREPRAGDWLWTVQSDVDDTVCEVIRPPCAVGDVLWVRETWRAIEQDDGADGVLFPDGSFCPIANTAEAADAWMAAYSNGKWGTGWRPSIHMPRWAARIFLRVEDVRVERVQDITEEDARAEGVLSPTALADLRHAFGDIRPWHREAFAALWDSLAPAGSKWADSPWVWVIRFKLEAPNVR